MGISGVLCWALVAAWAFPGPVKRRLLRSCGVWAARCRRFCLEAPALGCVNLCGLRARAQAQQVWRTGSLLRGVRDRPSSGATLLYGWATRGGWDGPFCQRLLVLFSVWVSEAADDVVCLNTDEVTLVQAVAICLFTSILGEIFDNRNLDRYSRGQSWRSLTVVCVSSKTWLSQFLPPPRAISVPLYPDLQNSPGFSSRALLCLKLCSTMQAADHTQVSAQAQPVPLSLICKVKSYLAESLCSDWVMGHRW